MSIIESLKTKKVSESLHAECLMLLDEASDLEKTARNKREKAHELRLVVEFIEEELKKQV